MPKLLGFILSSSNVRPEHLKFPICINNFFFLLETLPLKSSSLKVAVKPPLKDSQHRSRKEQCQGARSLLCRRPLAISERLWVSGNPVDDRWCDCPCKFFTLKWQLIWKYPVIIGERYSKIPLKITKKGNSFYFRYGSGALLIFKKAGRFAMKK